MYNFFISLKLYSLINQFSFYTSFYRITLLFSEKGIGKGCKILPKNVIFMLLHKKTILKLSIKFRFPAKVTHIFQMDHKLSFFRLVFEYIDFIEPNKYRARARKIFLSKFK